MKKADLIADCVLQTFEALPSKCKPRTLSNGRREWVPLAGIVLSRGNAAPTTLECAALSTGMKCLPQSKLSSANGNVLHDWHAEILALRSFNRFLLDECADLASRGRGERGQWVAWREAEGALDDSVQPFELQDNVEIHMYCSEAPCGDASMELTMASQSDATPWERQQYVGEDGLLGRGNFNQLGIVRRKPSRPDAPQSLSKSCSDKLALKQCTGLLSGLLTLLIHPSRIYLTSLVLPDRQLFPSAVNRCFGATGRMQLVAQEEYQARWRQSGYEFRPFEVQGTTREFEYCKSTGNDHAVPSNLSVMHTPQRQETLINGVLQGRKQTDPRGASCVSRRRMWDSIKEMIKAVGDSETATAFKTQTYAEVKKHSLLEAREQVKQDVKSTSLKGWKQNAGDSDWELS